MKRISFLLLALLLAVSLSFAQGTRPQTSGKKSAASSPPKAEKLDINTAPKDQLQELPGIGPATAQKIVDGRPYNAKNDLVKRKIISQSEYEKITDQIIAHRTKGTAPAGKKSGAKPTGQ